MRPWVKIAPSPPYPIRGPVTAVVNLARMSSTYQYQHRHQCKILFAYGVWQYRPWPPNENRERWLPHLAAAQLGVEPGLSRWPVAASDHLHNGTGILRNVDDI